MSKTKAGDLFAVPLTRFDRRKLEAVELGVSGLVKVFARDGETCFVAALDSFTKGGETHPADADVLRQQHLEELPHRGGKTMFAHASEVPKTWVRVSHVALSEAEEKLAALYGTWKNADLSMFDQMTACEALGPVSEGLTGLANRLGIEWRMRFDRDAILAELDRGRQKVERPKPTWRDVANVTIKSGTQELQAHLQPPYDAMIETLRDERGAIESALAAFYRVAYRHRMSGEYRDEIAELGADVGVACGLTRERAYGIAENAL